MYFVSTCISVSLLIESNALEKSMAIAYRGVFILKLSLMHNLKFICCLLIFCSL